MWYVNIMGTHNQCKGWWQAAQDDSLLCSEISKPSGTWWQFSAADIDGSKKYIERFLTRNRITAGNYEFKES